MKMNLNPVKITYMKKNKMPFLMALLPGMFYMYVVMCYILGAQIGFQMSHAASYIVAAVLTLGYGVLMAWYNPKDQLKAA